MPEIRRGAERGQGTVIEGIYAALLEREREERIKQTPIDPRCRYAVGHDHGLDDAPEECRPNRHRLVSLESSEPQQLQGREIKFLLPEHRQRRDDAFEWFEIRADDRVQRVRD
ncbi:hypothetical protein [Mycobacterium intracellulare]|uniref:hypothetical protein n=1 Tax=Mycobacterium intracellulare TaxID=1767 RepID=UPI00109EC874|nr:hypothetical protein [Mycobacterium intracellulare]